MEKEKIGEVSVLTVKKTDDVFYTLEDDKNKVYKVMKSESRKDLKTGDKVEAFTYYNEGKINISLQIPKMQVGDIGLLQVVSVSKIGYFLDIGINKDVLLPFTETIGKPKEGSELLVILYIDKSKRLAASMKIRKFLSSSSPYKKGDIVEGTVYNISKEFGVFIAVDNKYESLLPNAEVVGVYEKGDKVRLKIHEIYDDGKIVLSSKLSKTPFAEHKSDAHKIYDMLVENKGVLMYSDKSDPNKIREVFKMSKVQYKRAIGILYRQRKIIINEDCIVINKGDKNEY